MLHRTVLAMPFSLRPSLGAFAVLACLAAWWIAASLIHPVRFPSPEETLAAGRQLATTGYAGGTLATHALQSLRLALLGFAAAVALAVPLGVAMGCSRRLDAAIGPVIAALRPIPPLAWIPLAIVWFGLSDGSKLFVIVVTAFVPALVNTHTGTRGVDPALIEAARTHGAGRWALLRDVRLPGALPMIFVGLRLSLQASWMALVAAELVGSFAGLGRVLNVAAQDIFPGMILVAMLAVAAIGATLTLALGAIERRALPWLPGA